MSFAVLVLDSSGWFDSRDAMKREHSTELRFLASSHNSPSVENRVLISYSQGQ